ncbi:MAG TPA: Ig-like domain-containing protein [Candidatus Angelobacter sp.]
MKIAAKLVFPLVLFATAGFAQVNINSPGNGATVSSPVNFSAVATPVGGRQITAMRIYVDSNSVYLGNGPSLNTSVNMSPGGHNVTMQAWDNAGAVYKTALSVSVSGTASNLFQGNMSATVNWMERISVAPDGAILYGSSEIIPYYSNLAAIGMTRYPNSASNAVVENWMKWYINHLNWPDRWGLYGSIYDFNYNNGALTSHNNADSTDSYAATFLSLAWAFYSTGDAGAQSFVKTLAYQLDAIGQVIIKTSDADGLTWAKPDYHIKYLMDNAEVYRGLRDLALLWQNGFHDLGKADYYNAAANKMYSSLVKMYLGGGKWAWYKDALGRLPAPNLGKWYPDATAQMFPVMQGVLPGTDSRAIATYNTFNSAWPGWPNLSFNSQDPFPWVMIAGAAAQMGDSGRVNTYIRNIQNKYVNQGFPWTWYSMEAGWFIRLNSYMMGKRPL